MTAANSGNTLNMSAISKDEVLAKLHNLPVLSVVLQEVIASFKNDHLEQSSLVNKISLDQGLSAKILRVANSPFYGLSRRVGSIHDATLVIGFNGIRTLALSAGFMLAFPPTKASLFDRRTFWLHSFRVACYTQALAKNMGHDQQVAFTVGMFHDIGQLVMDVCIPGLFAGILEKQKASGLSLVEIKQAELGFDHAEIGAEMAKRWNFTSEIEQAIRYWRTPEHEPFEWHTGMVHVAVLLEEGQRGEALINHLSATLCDRLHLTWERIKAGIPETDQMDKEIKQLLET